MASEIGKIVHCKICGAPIEARGNRLYCRYAITRTAAMQPSAVMHGPKWSGNRRNVRKQK